MQKLLIFTDIDRTLLPNGKQPESPEARSISPDFQPYLEPICVACEQRSFHPGNVSVSSL